MSERTLIRYFGWSSFVIESEAGIVLFDPLYRSLYGANWSCLEDYQNAQVICVTHGHFDHYVDVPNILKQSDMTVVTSKEVCKHISSRYHIKNEHLVPVNPFQEIIVAPFKITAFEWRHRDVNFLKLLQSDPITSLQFIWLNFFKAPLNTPFFGFFIVGPNNLRLMNYCEGFNNTMKLKEVQELGERFKPDILLAGVQLNFEDYVAQGVAALAPKTVILYHPHTPLFEKVGLESSPVHRFVESIKQASSTVEILLARPKMVYLVPT